MRCVVAVRVVPAPAEDPQHLRAVLVRVGVVGLVHVPVGVRRRPCVADVAGGQEISIVSRPALSSKCEQCHVVS